jgi:hypothetical protein
LVAVRASFQGHITGAIRPFDRFNDAVARACLLGHLRSGLASNRRLYDRKARSWGGWDRLKPRNTMKDGSKMREPCCRKF